MQEHKNVKPLPQKEVERFQRFLEENGYEARIKVLEETIAEILTKLNGDKVES